MYDDKILKLAEACEILSISVATGRNWIRSGVLKPLNDDNEFEYKYIQKIKSDIKLNKIDRLNKRRNKRHVSGNYVPKKYITSTKGISLVETIVEDIPSEKINETLIDIIVAEYALKFFFYKNNIKKEIFLSDFDEEKHPIYSIIKDFLISSKIDRQNMKNILNEHKSIFLNPVFQLEDDVLGLLFMALNSVSNRKKKGIYYTPTEVVNDMVNNIQSFMEGTETIIDPCCGTGNFLIEFLKRGHPVEKINGIDIDKTSIFIARMNVIIFSKVVEEKYDIILNNIRNENSLYLIEKENKYDICVGNPPWGSELDDGSLLFSSYNFESYSEKGLEAFSLFIELGLKIIKNNGILSYIVPESFISIKTHKKIRGIFERLSQLKNLKFWGNVFDGVLAPAVSFVTRKEMNSKFGNGAIIIDVNNKKHVIGNHRTVDSDFWDFHVTDNQLKLLEKLDMSENNRYLKNNADFALGIVTGNNKKFITDKMETKEHQMIIKGSDVFKFCIKPSNTFILYEPEKFQQVASNNLYFMDEKLIYRFISDTLVFAYDNKKILSLNSANVVVPTIPDMNIKYIMAVLNSRLAHFYFKLKFNSIKILRNHIEAIPLRKLNKNIENEIVKLVNSMEKTKFPELHEKYEKLNHMIYDAYKLSEIERDMVDEFFDGNPFLE